MYVYGKKTLISCPRNFRKEMSRRHVGRNSFYFFRLLLVFASIRVTWFVPTRRLVGSLTLVFSSTFGCPMFLHVYLLKIIITVRQQKTTHTSSEPNYPEVGRSENKNKKSSSPVSSRHFFSKILGRRNHHFFYVPPLAFLCDLNCKLCYDSEI